MHLVYRLVLFNLDPIKVNLGLFQDSLDDL